MLLPCIETWQQWGQVFTDVALWRPAITEICKQAGLGEVKTFEAGFPGTNAVFVINGEYVVKVYAPWCHSDFYREKEIYGVVSKTSAIPTPVLLGTGILKDRIQWPYLIMAFSPGTAIRDVWDEMGASERADVARQMGIIVRAVHSLDIHLFSSLQPANDRWLDFLGRRRKECVKELRDGSILPEQVIDQVPEMLRILDDLPGGPCLVHADLTEDHTLLTKTNKGWEISAVIDWADAEIAHPEYEWVALWFGMLQQDSTAMRSFLKAYAPEREWGRDFGRRALAFTFLHRFGAGIIADVIPERQRMKIGSLDELQSILWPSTLADSL